MHSKQRLKYTTISISNVSEFIAITSHNLTKTKRMHCTLHSWQIPFSFFSFLIIVSSIYHTDRTDLTTYTYTLADVTHYRRRNYIQSHTSWSEARWAATTETTTVSTTEWATSNAAASNAASMSKARSANTRYSRAARSTRTLIRITSLWSSCSKC